MGKRNLIPLTDSSDDDCMIVDEIQNSKSTPKKVCKLEPLEPVDPLPLIEGSGKRSVLFKREEVQHAAARVLCHPSTSEVVTKTQINNSIRNVNYTNYGVEFHLERQQYYSALRVLEQSIGLTRLPEAKLLHSVLFKVSVSDDFNIRALLCSAISSLLAAHPPCDDELSIYYFSTMSRKFKDNDPSSHWQLLHELVEAVSLSNKDQDSQTGDETLLEFYLSVLEQDLKGYLNRWQEGQPVSPKLLLVRVFWPELDGSMGRFGFRCSELLRYHVKAITEANWKLLNFTRRLFQILNSLVNLHSQSSTVYRLQQPSDTLTTWCQSLFTSACKADLNIDWVFFIETFATAEVRLLLSSLLSHRLGMVTEAPERFTAQSIFQHYLKWNANSLDFLTTFRGYSTAEQKCFLLLVDSYLEAFHLREMFILLRKMSAGKERNLADATVTRELFTQSYAFDDLSNDLCFLKYLSKQTAFQTCSLSLLLSV